MAQIPAVLSILVVALALIGCGGGGTLRDGVYRKGDKSYRLGALPDGWSRVAFSQNDLAWTDGGGRVIAANAICEGHGDPSLKVLTDHLLLGFEGREIREREELRIAGRGALRTRADASLDGVPVELELTLLKKDGCVYDLVYTAPRGSFDIGAGAYRQLVEGFSADAGPR